MSMVHKRLMAEKSDQSNETGNDRKITYQYTTTASGQRWDIAETGKEPFGSDESNLR